MAAKMTQRPPRHNAIALPLQNGNEGVTFDARGQFEGERMHVTRWLIPLFCALFLAACGGGGDSSPPPAPPVADNDGSGDSGDDGACGVSAQIDFVEAVTDEWYLWYDEMASVDKGDYDSAQAYLDARLQPLIDDGRGGFSRMTTITEDETDISSGAYIGFGFRNDRSGLYITDVFEADQLGRRA